MVISLSRGVKKKKKRMRASCSYCWDIPGSLISKAICLGDQWCQWNRERHEKKKKRPSFISGTHQQPSGQDVQLTASSFHSISTPAAPPCCAGSAGTGNATAHTYTRSDIQASHGPPPFSHAELPVYAKDNWPNGLSLPPAGWAWGEEAASAPEY